jgi:hypothetical protein
MTAELRAKLWAKLTAEERAFSSVLTPATESDSEAIPVAPPGPLPTNLLVLRAWPPTRKLAGNGTMGHRNSERDRDGLAPIWRHAPLNRRQYPLIWQPTTLLTTKHHCRGSMVPLDQVLASAYIARRSERSRRCSAPGSFFVSSSMRSACW